MRDRINQLRMAAGRSYKMGGMQTHCDASIGEMEDDPATRRVFIYQVKDGQRTGQVVWVPYEAVSYAEPAASEETPEAKAARRRDKKERETLKLDA